MSDKKKILIVEDDVFVREIYNTKFLKEGFDVILAENGIQALERLSNGIPDLILLDIVMPYMDGIEALKKIKENENWNKIPIIMLTNISEKERVEEGTDLGVSDYLIKSHFLPGEVVAKVNSILKK